MSLISLNKQSQELSGIKKRRNKKEAVLERKLEEGELFEEVCWQNRNV